LSEAISIARRINKPHDTRFHELLDPSGLDEEDFEGEILDLANSVKESLSQMTNGHLVSGALAGYPQAPYSDLVSMCVCVCVYSYRFYTCFWIMPPSR